MVDMDMGEDKRGVVPLVVVGGTVVVVVFLVVCVTLGEGNLNKRRKSKGFLRDRGVSELTLAASLLPPVRGGGGDVKVALAVVVVVLAWCGLLRSMVAAMVVVVLWVCVEGITKGTPIQNEKDSIPQRQRLVQCLYSTRVFWTKKNVPLVVLSLFGVCCCGGFVGRNKNKWVDIFNTIYTLCTFRTDLKNLASSCSPLRARAAGGPNSRALGRSRFQVAPDSVSPGPHTPRDAVFDPVPHSILFCFCRRRCRHSLRVSTKRY